MKMKYVVKSKIVGLARLAAVAAVCMGTSGAAVSGEMGTGVPQFGLYGNAAFGTPYAMVWSLGNPTLDFQSGCSRLKLTPETMGMDTYKAAVAMMMTAKVTGRRIRFYAHAARDGGCGIDYVELQE